MTHLSKTFGWTVALAIAAAAAMTGPSFADRTATDNQRAQEGKLLQMPLTDFLFNSSVISASKVGEVLMPGDIIGRFDVSVTQTARLKVDTLSRRGSYPKSVPAGTILFQVQLDNGVGFCTPLLPDQGVRRTQCFRDLNNDGTFDAGYITDYIDRGQRIYGGRLQGLSPIPQTPYELTPGDLIPAEPADVVVRSISGNTVKFDYKLNGVKLTEKECQIDGTKPCQLLSQTYLFEVQSGGIKIVAHNDPTPS
jgi:hypothetical protein